MRYYAYSRAVINWTGHADKELEDYVTKKSGGTGPLMSRVSELTGLAQKGYRALAIAEYKEVTRIEPDNPEHHFMLGAQFEAEGATKAYTGYHFDARSHTDRPRSAALPKSARADYQSALEQYRLAHELAPDNKSYKEAYERMEHQLKHP